MIYELSVVERLQLLDILPSEGDVVTLRVIMDLRRELSFSEQEMADSGILQSGPQVTWKPDASSKPIEIGPKALSLITQSIERMNAEKRLHISRLPLYERFVEGVKQQVG